MMCDVYFNIFLFIISVDDALTALMNEELMADVDISRGEFAKD